MNLTLEHMPGPDEARELQLKQWAAYGQLMEAFSAAGGVEESFTAPAVVAARRDYEATVSTLKQLLGPTAHCNAVDCDAWSMYSDCFKSEVGFRPKGHVTLDEVLQWFEARTNTTHG